MKTTAFDVVVVGGGMVGAATACLLLREGFSVALIEAREPPEFDESKPFGLRVSALSPGSQAILAHSGAWKIVAERRHCAYRRMHVEETDEGHAAELEFAAAEFGLERLGTIVENDSISSALWQVLEARGIAGDRVELCCPDQLIGLESSGDDVTLCLASGRAIAARLVVGADGPRSQVRGLAGIDQRCWSYGQRGIVSVVRAEQANPGVAWQRFMEGGPLAFLPLNDGSSSIVWTRPEREATRLLSLSDEDFGAELGLASGEWLGPVATCGPRASFDLTMRLSDRYAARRIALVGDAAHLVHPLAGQGVNMGLLDAAALVELLAAARKEQEGWATESVLSKVLGGYSRWRRSDAEVMAHGIHGLRALFMPTWLGPVRRLGLRLVSKSWMAREAFLRRAAGLYSDAPALARQDTSRG